MGLIILLPLLGRGFVLVYDMAFVPRPRLSSDLLGLGTTVPRSVPFGLIIALISPALSGVVAQKLVLLGIPLVGAWGVIRLVPGRFPARMAGGVLYAWNPFVYERFLLGQAPFLLSVAVLPWAVGAAIGIEHGGRRSWALLTLAIAAAAVTSPYGGVFATAMGAIVVVAAAEGLRTRVRRGVLVLAIGVALDLPWLVPAMVRPQGLPSPPLGFDLFRSRPDSPLGLFGSLISLGGLWRTDLAPSGRNTLAWVPAFVIMMVVAVVGWGLARRRLGRGPLRGLVGCAAGGLLLAMGVGAPGLGGAIRWAGVHLPGGGILRDGQKFVAPWALLLALAFGAGVERLLATARVPAGSARRRMGLAVVAAALIALPVATAPTLAWGASGRVFTATYPSSWNAARTIMARDPTPGAVLVLPWHLYLPFGWNRGQVSIQPARSFFTRAVVESDSLEVGRYRLPAEDPWSRLADTVVRSGRPLAPDLPRLGVRYLLLFHEADWRSFVGRTRRLRAVLRRDGLVLYRSTRPARPVPIRTPPAPPVIAGDIVALGVVLEAVALAGRRRPRTRPGVHDAEST